MLSAYYSYGNDSDALFDALQIAKDASYVQHLNQYDVLKINMQDFLSENSVTQVMKDIHAQTHRSIS